MMRIRWVPDARVEALQAARYYSEKDPTLGPVFRDELHHQLQLAAKFPESGFHIPSGKGAHVRRTLIDRFEYAVAYAVFDDSIMVVAVHHQHRKPDYWRPRLAKVRP